MLVTRRRSRESIFIGEEVEIKVLEIGPSWVKLGIDAPKEISVLRSEQKLTREENLAAARALPTGALSDLVRRVGGKSLTPAAGARAAGSAPAGATVAAEPSSRLSGKEPGGTGLARTPQ